MSTFTIHRFVSYFFRGLLFVVPVALTVYIIYQVLQWVDSLIPIEIPGLGLIVIVGGITFLGYLASFFITRPIFLILEKYLAKIPLVNILYTSIKDLIGAFVGDQKKFNKPVLVAVDNAGIMKKIGFITNTAMDKLGEHEYISVYMPHSYAWSGNQFLVKKEYVTPLSMSATAAMKFVVSGGVSGLEEIEATQ